MRSDKRKYERNVATISELRTLDKKLQLLSKEPEKAIEAARLLASRYDRAVSRGVIPRGRADRKKSRIALFLSKISAKK